MNLDIVTVKLNISEGSVVKSIMYSLLQALFKNLLMQQIVPITINKLKMVSQKNWTCINLYMNRAKLTIQWNVKFQFDNSFYVYFSRKIIPAFHYFIYCLNNLVFYVYERYHILQHLRLVSADLSFQGYFSCFSAGFHFIFVPSLQSISCTSAELIFV